MVLLVHHYNVLLQRRALPTGRLKMVTYIRWNVLASSRTNKCGGRPGHEWQSICLEIWQEPAREILFVTLHWLL